MSAREGLEALTRARADMARADEDVARQLQRLGAKARAAKEKEALVLQKERLAREETRKQARAAEEARDKDDVRWPRKKPTYQARARRRQAATRRRESGADQLRVCTS